MRDRRPMVVVAIVAAALVGCARQAEADGAAAARRDDREPPSRALAALTSIYAYAYDAAHPSSGKKLPTLGIVDAAKILGDPQLIPDGTKRRRAIAVLASAGDPPTTMDGEWQPPDVQSALRAIGAPMRELNAAFIRETRRGLPFDKQWLAYTVLSKTDGPWQQECCACLWDWDIDPDPDPPGDIVSAYFRITVPRPRAEMRPLIDPQSWGACSPDFFPTTKVIAVGDGLPCAASPLCSTAKPPFLSSPPAPGTAWKGTLFEHYQIQYAAGSACPALPGNHGAMYVRNVFRVETNQTSDADQVDYGVCRTSATPPVGAIDSAIDCECEQHGVDVDCGRTRVIANDTNASWVLGYKYLKFSKRAIDYDLKKWATVGLRMMIDEIVEKGVCCTFPGGSGTPAATSCKECPPPSVVEDPGHPSIGLCSPPEAASDQ